jgi:hypothetical protein
MHVVLKSNQITPLLSANVKGFVQVWHSLLVLPVTAAQ